MPVKRRFVKRALSEIGAKRVTAQSHGYFFDKLFAGNISPAEIRARFNSYVNYRYKQEKANPQGFYSSWDRRLPFRPHVSAGLVNILKEAQRRGGTPLAERWRLALEKATPLAKLPLKVITGADADARKRFIKMEESAAWAAKSSLQLYNNSPEMRNGGRVWTRKERAEYLLRAKREASIKRQARRVAYGT